MFDELQFTIAAWLKITPIATARLAPAFLLLPFFASNVLTAVIRLTVLMMVGLSFWPETTPTVPLESNVAYFFFLSRELSIGLLLFFVINLPFSICHAVGAIIDNQRGATISSSMDPLTGIDTSELANLLNLSAVVIFLHQQGIIIMLEAFRDSYQLLPIFSTQLPELLPVFQFMAHFVGKALVIAAPIIIGLLMLESILAILSRYAAQMNAFSIALTVKSSLAFFILFHYFNDVLPSIVQQNMLVSPKLQSWFGR